jgi:drug/metabolite transporter (DMT)-like permease
MNARVAATAPRASTGFLLAALGAIGFSGKAIIVKLGFRHGADAVILLGLRMLVALPFFVAMGWWASRRGAAGARAMAVSRRDGYRILALGFFGYYLASFLDFAGLAYISATLERLILYLTPTIVLAIHAIVFRRAVGTHQLAALLLSYAGVALAFAHDVSFGGGNIALGSALVFGSALSYSLYLVGSGELVARVGALRLTAYASSVASVLCIAQCLLLRPASALIADAGIWRLSLLNGTLCTVLPVLAMMMAIERIGAGIAAQIGMIGPVSTIVLSVLVLGEAMGPWQVAGTLLVMLGVFFVSRRPAQ